MNDFIQFLSRSPTAYHAVKEISNRLAEKDFIPLSEEENWQLEKGKSYFVEKEGTLLCAFRMPKKKVKSAIILASHTDSPALKIKPQPDISSHDMAQLGTEVYGGPLLHTWLDKNLAIAGNIETDLGSQLVYLEDLPIVIPQLAIHLDRNINEKGILVHKQEHLKAVFSLKKEDTLETVLKRRYGFKKLYAFDLFLVPIEPPSVIGLYNDLFAGYRIDNLSSAYSSLQAITHSHLQDEILQVAIFWDHEEIGSFSSTGAFSCYLDQLLDRIIGTVDSSKEHFYQMKSRSITLSVDVAHAFNPNYPEKYDPQNSAYLGKGVVIKFNAARKYASDAKTAKTLFKIADHHKIPLQKSANRSDIPSGSTVGPIMSAQTGIKTVDLGLACWAMHSTREVISVEDFQSQTKFLTHMLNDWQPDERPL